MTIELQHLRHLVALVEHGSFMRAAAALGMSQPALSHSIKKLERQLGAVLFTRNSSGAVPTDSGLLQLERARDLLRLADDFVRTAGGQRTLQTGHLSVGAGPYPAESVIGRAAARFVEQFPRVSMQIRVNTWGVLLQQLRSRELDFIVLETSQLKRERDIEVPPFTYSQTVYFVARSEHPLAAQPNVQVGDVFGWPIVAPTRIPPPVLDQLLAAQHTAFGASSPKHAFPAIECSDLTTVKRIVENSDAITAVSLTCVADELERGRFIALCTAPWLHLSFGVVSLKGRPLTQAAEKFRSLVLDVERDVAREDEQLVARWASMAATATGTGHPPSRT
jgi:DNA-binding transcriptional LysR family regulator